MESLQFAREIGDRVAIAYSLDLLGTFWRAQEDYTQASAYYEDSLAIFKAIHNQEGSAWGLHNLGHLALRIHDIIQAVTRFTEAITLAYPLSYTHVIVACLSGLAGCAYVVRQSERAVELFGYVGAMFERIGEGWEAPDRIAYQYYVALLRSQLNSATFAAKWDEGRAMTLDEAIAEALDIVNR